MNITRRVNNLANKYNTHDPFKIAKHKGIDICYYDLGEIKGIYKSILGNKFIAINENIDELSMMIVAAHELGHAVLHSSKSIQLMKDEFLLPNNGLIEMQANKFAAELLINEYTTPMIATTYRQAQLINKLNDLKEANIN